MFRNDDSYVSGVGIGFPVNFFGTTYTTIAVNNNGNVTFDGGMSTYTPFPILTAGRKIIAPFFGDVDTRNGASDVTRWGSTTFGGRPAFCATWAGIGVGYYSFRVDKLNNFQLLLVDRSDVAPGDFDIIFNYDRIQWEAGQASGGVNGLGGYSARAGWSNGSAASYELAGSAVNGAFLDSNPTSGLIYNSLNSSQLGRYIFFVRNGVVLPPTNAAPELGAVGPFSVAEGGSMSLTAAATDADGDALTYTWDLDNDGVYETAGQTVTFSAAALDGPASQAVKVRVSDGDADDTATTTVDVTNVAPTATLDAPASVSEGSSFTIELDNGADAAPADVLSYAFDCGDGFGYGPDAPTASATCATTDDGSRSIKAKIMDDDGGVTEYAGTVAIANVAPAATFVAPAVVDVFDAFTLSLDSVVDPGADTFEYRFDCGSGYGAWGTGASASCPTSTIGTRAVKGEVRDDDGGSTEYTSSVAVVDRVAPTGSCVLGTNPSGKNKPNQNAGFRLVTGADNYALASIVIADSAGSWVSGEIPTGSTVKLTQSPDEPASDTRPGPGGILAHIKTVGDPILRLTDSSGNITNISCGNLPPK